MAKSRISAKEIMTREVVVAYPNMSVEEAAKLLNKFRIGGLPVVKRGRLVGMLTERDIMRKVVGANLKPRDVKVKDIMSKKPIIATENTDMNDLVRLMAEEDVTRLPIVKDKKSKLLVGIVTIRDLLYYSRELIDVLLEQAKIKGKLKDYPAFGKCELCGCTDHLLLKKGFFVCERCASQK